MVAWLKHRLENGTLLSGESRLAVPEILSGTVDGVVPLQVRGSIVPKWGAPCQHAVSGRGFWKVTWWLENRPTLKEFRCFWSGIQMPRDI